MKKLIIVFVIGLFSITSSAQPDDFLFAMDWYLNSFKVDGGNYPIPFNSEVSNALIQFDDITLPYTFSATVCGELSGEISFPNIDNFIFPMPLVLSGGNCAQTINQEFQNKFFEFFASDLEFEYSISVVDPDPPNYYLEITNANGDQAVFTEQPRILSASQFPENTFKIFPNPVSNMLFIETPNSESINIKLMTVQGVLLEESNANQISLRNYPNGIYFVEVATNDGFKQINKIVKQ